MATKSKAQAGAVPQPSGDDEVYISRDALRAVRDALLVGLSCYGEIERLMNQVEVMEICHEAVPKDLKPIHPTGSACTVADFADALRFVAMADRCADSEATNG